MTTLDPRAIEIAAKWLEDEEALLKVLTDAGDQHCCWWRTMGTDPLPGPVTEAMCTDSVGCEECIANVLVAAHRRVVKGGPA